MQNYEIKIYFIMKINEDSESKNSSFISWKSLFLIYTLKNNISNNADLLHVLKAGTRGRDLLYTLFFIMTWVITVFFHAEHGDHSSIRDARPLGRRLGASWIGYFPRYYKHFFDSLQLLFSFTCLKTNGKSNIHLFCWFEIGDFHWK